jgi:hypothetical protein
MNIKKNTKLTIFAVMVTIFLAGNSYAQSMTIPTVAVVKGTTAAIHLEYDAGGDAKNIDFTMSYNPNTVDENDPGFTVTCNPANVGLTSLTCTIDKDNDEIRGIGVNNPDPLDLPLDALTSGEFAVIQLPIRNDAPEGESFTTFTANFAAGAGTEVTALDTTWTPKVNLTFCNEMILSGDVYTSDTAVFDEACETLVVDSAYFVGSDLPDVDEPVFLSGGLQIRLLPGFLVETGVELSAEVCGQSLCTASEVPMPDGCHSCVVVICAIDSDCCTDAYDQSCVDKVNSECGLVCTE